MSSLVALSVAVFSLAGCATVNSQAPALVEFQRSGGIAGREDRLVIHADGTAELYRRGAVSHIAIAEDTLARLRSLLEAIKFERLRAEYLPSRPRPDVFEYVVVYGNRRVRTVDTAVPPEMQPLIDFFNGLLAGARG